MSEDNGGHLPDIFGIGKLTRPVEKLMECVRDGAGAWFEPHRIRRRAEAEAAAQRTLAQAAIDTSEIAYRAQLRREDRELRRQRNIESILKLAALELPEAVSDQRVDPDWAAFFFSSCEDIGSNTMHALWARLLAGEVASPGTYSLRTLLTVKTLSTNDATLFTTFASYCWSFGNLPRDVFPRYAMFGWPDIYAHLRNRGASSIGINELCALGLLGDQIKVGLPRDVRAVDLKYCEKAYTLRRPHSDQWLILGLRPLSSVGNELYPICGAQPIEGLAERVRSILWGAGKYVLGPKQPEDSSEARLAEYAAEINGWIPVSCDRCNGAGRNSFKDERGATISTAEPCQYCRGGARLWIPENQTSAQNPLLDVEIIGRFRHTFTGRDRDT